MLHCAIILLKKKMACNLVEICKEWNIPEVQKHKGNNAPLCYYSFEKENGL